MRKDKRREIQEGGDGHRQLSASEWMTRFPPLQAEIALE